MRYDEERLEEREVEQVDELLPLRGGPGVLWIDVVGVHQTEVLEKLGNAFGLHPLVIEDILNTDQRAKIENYRDYLYIVLKSLFEQPPGGAIAGEQISVILAKNLVISFQESESPLFDATRERIRTRRGRLRLQGADFLAYTLIDAVVDNYFIVLERLGERIEQIEAELIKNPTTETIQGLHHLKREMLFLRKSIWPLREVVSSMEREQPALITKGTLIYLRDVYDHTIHVIDTIEIYRDMLSGMIDIYLSSLSFRLNEIMKVLTIIATLFIPLTFITGVYGMNFKYMPELGWRWGYPAVLVMMLLVMAVMVRYFRRKNWF